MSEANEDHSEAPDSTGPGAFDDTFGNTILLLFSELGATQLVASTTSEPERLKYLHSIHPLL